MILAKLNVADFDRFLSVFKTDGAEHRRKFGSKGSRVLKNAENPNEVWVLFDWSKEDFHRFLDDARAREIMTAAGLQGPPDAVFVESVAEVDS